MRKILWIIGCIILAGGLFALDYWQGYNNKLLSEQLEQDNIQIQQLKNERSQLEKEVAETEQQDTAEKDSETPGALLCFNSIDQKFYTEIYPVVKEYGDFGILVLDTNKLPGDSNYITAQELSELVEKGWSCAISLDRNADDSQWKANIENYLNRLSSKTSVKPTVYYLPSGSCNENDAQILKEYGFTTVLCHEQSMANTVGGINIVQLFGYNDTATISSVLASENSCGLEIWVNWNQSTRTRVRYTSTALQNLLNNSMIKFQSLEDLLDTDIVSETQTPKERIAEIDAQIHDLYY